ncbi:MAG: nucleotidyltransferase domain-containing protein [Chloroflexi bacterium]|nr:MAG: nucleotidyltransferase domain-containing protein [Chloroflexota bacterium]
MKLRKKRRILSIEEKKQVLGTLRRVLMGEEGLCVAYVHGSFIKDEPFHDIDLALYYDPLPQGPVLDRELDLEVELWEALRRVRFNIPVDVRILNAAPLSFRFVVINTGELLLVRDDDKRVEFETTTWSKYFDFAPMRDEYFKEVLGF